VENNLYVDSCNTTIGQKSVKHKGPKVMEWIAHFVKIVYLYQNV